MIYLALLFLLIILSLHYDINRKKVGRDQWYWAMLVVLIMIAGLRFRTTVDTIAYLYFFYHGCPDLLHLDYTRLDTFKFEPLWVLLNSSVKTLGGKFFVVQIVQASIVNIIIFKLFKKHSSYPFLCIFFYYIFAYHYFCMMIMRNATAIAFCLLANDFLLERKWKKAYLLYFVAVMFHYSSALFMLIHPCLLFLRFNKIGLLCLFSMLIVGKVLNFYFGDLFALMDFNEVVSNKLFGHEERGRFSTENLNLNYFMVALVLPITYIILSLYHVKKNHSKPDLLKLEPFVMMGLMFLVLQFNVGMLHRFSRAYEFYFILFFVQFFMDMSKAGNFIPNAVSLVRTFVVFLPLLLQPMHKSVLSDTYSPYYTVIERKIDREKELHYIISRGYTKKVPSKDEY
jgi:hypothetical protein